ncbi:MAG: response regulator transcription factor [Ilumatobacteraceae bacterium]
MIAEDQALLREGLARLFRDERHDVVGTFGDALQLMDHLDDPGTTGTVDLVVVDIRMPPTHTTEGLEAARAIKHWHPNVGVLVLSQHIEAAGIVDLVGHPGFGYLLKDRVLEVDEFLAAAERVAGGGFALDQKVVASMVTPNVHTPLSRLSEREREVLALMAEGLTNNAIARRLVVSDRTVEAHIRHVLTKLGIPDHGESHRRVLAVLTHIRAARI